MKNKYRNNYMYDINLDFRTKKTRDCSLVS